MYRCIFSNMIQKACYSQIIQQSRCSKMKGKDKSLDCNPYFLDTIYCVDDNIQIIQSAINT